MPFQTVIRAAVPEAVTAKISANLVDENGDPIALVDLLTLTITIYDQTTDAIINGKNDTDIKNTGGGTVAATSGDMTYILTPADNAMIGTAATEIHVVLIEWTYNSGNSAGRHQILITIQNFNKVP